jgi:putative secretion ATPase (PEP-CTERM system associated)
MYEEYFGFSAKPFQPSPDVAFFYPSHEHQRALSFLEYGLDQADGFIVITGDVGTGKTTLVHALLAELDDDTLKVATIVTTQLAEGELLQLVAANFGFRVRQNPNKASLLQGLQDAFTKYHDAGKRMLLIVDEAQNLPPRSIEELRMLSNFQIAGKPLVQIFLLGQQEFRATLLSDGFEQLRQRVIATYHLNPLTSEETRTYIEHRLSHVGWKGHPNLSDEAFVAVFEVTGGVPRRINNLCDRLLLYTFLEEGRDISRESVETIAGEIGEEFSAGKPVRPPSHVLAQPLSQPAVPLDDALGSAARGMFDKANLQQRLASLERAVDSLGAGLKPEITELKEELSFIRLILEDVLHELREPEGGPRTRQRRA